MIKRLIDYLLPLKASRVVLLTILNLRQCLKNLLVICLSLSLVITPQIILAADILIHSGLKHFEMDLGSALMTVDDIDSRLQLTVDPKGALNVSHFHAKRITLHIKTKTVDAVKDNPQNSPGVLPDKISLPFPMALQAGVVDELIIVRGTQQDVLQNLQFNLDANSNNLALALSVETSPWGKLNTDIAIENQKPFKLAGAIHLDQNASDFPYRLRANLSGSLQDLRFETRNILNYADDRFYLTLFSEQKLVQENNEVQTKNTVISTRGNLSLEGNYPVSFQMAITNLDPAYFHPQLAGVVNLNLGAVGVLSPSSKLALNFKATDSSLREQALILNANASIINGQLTTLNAQGKLANNTFNVSGDATSNIQWQADFTDISVLGKQFAGALFAKGSAAKSADTTTHRYEMRANKLRLPDDMHIDTLHSKGEISTAENGQLNNETVLEGFSQHAANELDFKRINAKLTLAGTQKSHALTMDINNHRAEEKVLGLHAKIAGGFTTDGWQGHIEYLNSLDEKTIRLQAPAPMRFSRTNGFALQNLQLRINQGLFAMDNLVLDQHTPAPYQLQSSGRIQQIALQDIQDYLLLRPSKLKNDLVLNGRWNVAVNDTVNADIALWRESGDLRVYKEDAADSTINLGLETVQANIKIDNNQVTADAEINGRNSGFVRGKLNTQLSRLNKQIGLAKTAPLTLELDANLKTLSWIPLPETLEDAGMDGAFSLALKANGTLAKPNMQGSLNGNNLKLNAPSLGLALDDGALQAQFKDKLLIIQQLAFKGGEGRLSATGDASYNAGQPSFKLTLRANNFTTLSRTDRHIVVAGDSEMRYENSQLTLNGQLKVLRGLFELPKQSMPKLDADVVVLGREPIEAASPLAINIDALRIDFGDKPALPINAARAFMLRGSGINAALSGVITLSGKPDEQLNAAGSLQLTGTYLTYGQLLDIESGRINFSGPITNAGLNITAMRNIQPTKAGVKIAGTLQAPTVRLVSEPEVSESDKLSLLVIGQPMSEADDSELALLSLAAGALLSDGESVPLQTRIANTAGLDALDISGSDASTYSVNVGKRLSSNLYLGYEKSLFGLLNVAKLTYQLTQRISVETRAGSDSAVDLLYSFDFD